MSRSKDPTIRAGAGIAPEAATTLYSLETEETERFGQVFAQRLRGGELIVLQGDLGLGKTVFARGLAVGLGLRSVEVSSPTFTLVHEHLGGRLPFYHVDLYRLEDPSALSTLGLEELLSAGAVVAVEWGEKLPPYLRHGAISIRFSDLGEDSRRIDIDAPRPASGPDRTDQSSR